MLDYDILKESVLVTSLLVNFQFPTKIVESEAESSNGGGGGGGGCFPSMAKVQLKNGNFVTISELKIRDCVQTGKIFKKFYIKPLGCQNISANLTNDIPN